MADLPLQNGHSAIPAAEPAAPSMADIEMADTPTAPSAPNSINPSLLNPTEPISAASEPVSAPTPPAAATTPSGARASPHPTASITLPPSQPNPHGSPARVYLNQNVTPYLLEGVKYLAVYEPEKPLKWLAEFLEKKSREVEGA